MRQTRPASSTAEYKSTDICVYQSITSHRNNRGSSILQEAESHWSCFLRLQSFFLFSAFSKVFPTSICILPSCACHLCTATEKFVHSGSKRVEGLKAGVKGELFTGAYGCVCAPTSSTFCCVFWKKELQAGASKALHIVFFYHWFLWKRKPREPN